MKFALVIISVLVIVVWIQGAPFEDKHDEVGMDHESSSHSSSGQIGSSSGHGSKDSLLGHSSGSHRDASDHHDEGQSDKGVHSHEASNVGSRGAFWTGLDRKFDFGRGSLTEAGGYSGSGL